MARHIKKARTATVAAATVAAVAMTGGLAYAYWTTSGSGSGSTSVGTMTAPSVSGGTVSGGQLYPGATATTAGDLVVTASNPNPFPITVTLMQGPAAVTGCTTPAVTFAGGSFTLTANETAATKTITKSVSMGTNVSDDCQGKTLTIPLTTSSQSN